MSHTHDFSIRFYNLSHIKSNAAAVPNNKIIGHTSAKKDFFSLRCRKTQAKSLVFSYKKVGSWNVLDKFFLGRKCRKSIFLVKIIQYRKSLEISLQAIVCVLKYLHSTQKFWLEELKHLLIFSPVITPEKKDPLILNFKNSLEITIFIYMLDYICR